MDTIQITDIFSETQLDDKSEKKKKLLFQEAKKNLYNNGGLLVKKEWEKEKLKSIRIFGIEMFKKSWETGREAIISFYENGQIKREYVADLVLGLRTDWFGKSYHRNGNIKSIFSGGCLEGGDIKFFEKFRDRNYDINGNLILKIFQLNTYNRTYIPESPFDWEYVKPKQNYNIDVVSIKTIIFDNKKSDNQYNKLDIFNDEALEKFVKERFNDFIIECEDEIYINEDGQEIDSDLRYDFDISYTFKNNKCKFESIFKEFYEANEYKKQIIKDRWGLDLDNDETF